MNGPIISLLAVVTVFCSCEIGDKHRHGNEIFNAYRSGASGSLYFSLYKDSSYEICARGKIAQDCFSGKYDLKGDTIILLNLNPEVSLKHNRLLIVKDSVNGPGNVYPLNNQNQIVRDSAETNFTIKADSLRYYRQ